MLLVSNRNFFYELYFYHGQMNKGQMHPDNQAKSRIGSISIKYLLFAEIILRLDNLDAP